MKKVGYIIIGCLLSIFSYSQTIMSYNVENLFYHSSTIPYSHYRQKIHHIASVIASLPTLPAIIGLNEIEKDSCLMDLCRAMPHYPYRYIHYDSPDMRGIDVAMVYDSTKVKIITTYPIPVFLDSTTVTRDILYVQATILKDSFHLFVVHLPSQLGGSASTQWKRDSVYAVLKHHIGSIYSNDTQPNIIILGDFNDTPMDNLPPLHNVMLTMAKNGLGTHKYQGQWSCLDQFYVSPSLVNRVEAQIYDASFLLEEDDKYLSTQPKRTHKGYRYQKEGYSDHLPILLNIYSNSFLSL